MELILFDAMERVAIPKILQGAYAGANTVLIICAETRPFRFLAQRLEIPNVDNMTCLDLGCSTGETTGLLAKRFKKVIGVDVSQEVVDIGMKDNAELDLRVFDVLADREALKRLIEGEVEGGCPAFFIDIGGDRMHETVTLFLSYLIGLYAPKLMVVKSRKLYRQLVKFGGVEADKIHYSVEKWNQYVADITEKELRERKCFHPQRYPLRLVPNSDTAICRYFSNTGVCKKGDECEQDHRHCHHCQAFGHRAMDCEILANELIVRKRKS